MSTLSTYRDAVKLRGYDSVPDAKIDVAVQEGRRRVLEDHDWSFMEFTTTLATTPGSETVSLAGLTTLGDIQAVRLSDASGRIPCEFKPIEQMRDLQDDYGTAYGWAGDPQFWSTREDDLIFWPTPRRALTVTVEGTQKVADLAAAPTADVIPDRHADLVAWAAVVPLAFRQRDFTASSAADQYYVKVLLPRHKGKDQSKQSQSPVQIKTGYWGS